MTTLQRRRLSVSQYIIFTITILSLSFTRASCFMHGRRTLAAAFMGPSSRDYQSTAANDEDEIVLPERKYRYASEPFTWPDLVEIIDGDEPNLAKLSRSVQQQRDYMIYTRNMLREWSTVYDHILVSKFGFGKRLVQNLNATHDGRNETLWEAYPPLSEVSEVKKVLCENDFPYFTSKGIEHWCLWKLCKDIEDEEVEEAKEELRRIHCDELEFLSWRNPPHLKSLPNIDHVHFLIRKAESPN